MSGKPLENSHRKRQMRLFVFSLSLAGICAFLATFNMTQSPSRDLASTPGPANAPSLKMTQKLSQPFWVSIEMKMDLSNDQTLMQELTGKIKALRHVDKLEYEWVLPDGVRLIRGQKAGFFDLSQSEYQIDITISAENLENYKIHLKVQSADEKVISSQVAQFNTLNQKEIDREKEKLVERSKAHMSDRQMNE